MCAVLFRNEDLNFLLAFLWQNWTEFANCKLAVCFSKPTTRRPHVHIISNSGSLDDHYLLKGTLFWESLIFGPLTDAAQFYKAKCSSVQQRHSERSERSLLHTMYLMRVEYLSLLDRELFQDATLASICYSVDFQQGDHDSTLLWEKQPPSPPGKKKIYETWVINSICCLFLRFLRQYK